MTNECVETPALLRDSGMCFACGAKNPIGLCLSFGWDGNNYVSRYTPDENHQGWAGRVHGGMIALVMDEVLARAALDRFGLDWVTVELTVRLLRPARIAAPLHFRGQIEASSRRLIVCVGEAIDEATGETVATGRAKLMHPGKGSNKMDTGETNAGIIDTPLMRAGREEALMATPAGQDLREEREADLVVADIDSYVAENDPDSLAEAESALNAWEMPIDPHEQQEADSECLAGTREPLVPVFSAGTEPEANIVRGILESEGIPVAVSVAGTMAYGTLLNVGEGQWGNLLVSPECAVRAREIIAAQQSTE